MPGALTRRVGAVALAQAALLASAVGTDMVLGWLLEPAANGHLQAALIVVRVLTLVGVLGIPTSLYYLYPRSEEADKRRLLAQSVGILGLAGAVLGALVWMSGPQLASWLGEPPSSAALLRAGALVIALTLPAVLSEPLLIVQGRTWAAAANAWVAAAVQVALVAWLVRRGHCLERLLEAIALTQATRLAVSCFVSFRRREPGPGAGARLPRRELLSAQFAVALPIGLTAALDALSVYADRTIVARLFSPAELALYRYGAQEVPFVGLLLGALTPVLLPAFSELLPKGRSREVLEIWHRAAAKAALGLFGIFWGAMWLAPELLSFLYSPRYASAAPFFRIYLLLLPLRVVAYMPMLYALGRARFVAGVAAGEVVLGATISLLLARQMGLPGAAWGPVIATGVQATVYLTAIAAALQVPWGRILPWRILGKHFVIAALLAAPLGLLKLVPLPYGLAVGAGALWGALYLRAVVWPAVRGTVASVES